MSLWLKNGRLLILNGSAVDCDYCPCDPPSDSGSSASESTSDCDECYNCIVVCGMNIATPFTIYVNGVAATLPVASVDPFQAAGSVDIGCSILDIIVSFDDECNFTISIDGVEKVLAPDDYEFEPDFSATTTISHPTCGTLAVEVYNGGSPQGCSLVCCDPSVSDSSSSGSSVSSSGSGGTVETCVCDGIGTPSVITLTANGVSIPLTYSPSIGSLGGWAGSGWTLEIGSFCLLGLTSPSCGGITWYPEDYPFGNESTLYYACSPLYMSGTIENQVIGCAPISVEITL